jgi:hypothetical protein
MPTREGKAEVDGPQHQPASSSIETDAPVMYIFSPPALLPSSSACKGVCNSSAPIPPHHEGSHLRQPCRPNPEYLANHELEWSGGVHQNLHNAATLLFGHACRHGIPVHIDRHEDQDDPDVGKDISRDGLSERTAALSGVDHVKGRGCEQTGGLCGSQAQVSSPIEDAQLSAQGLNR